MDSEEEWDELPRMHHASLYRDAKEKITDLIRSKKNIPKEVLPEVRRRNIMRLAEFGPRSVDGELHVCQK